MGSVLLRSCCAHCLFFSAVACALASSPAWAENVVRVEEDWELHIGNPDPNSNGPQVTCMISPSANTEAVHAAFEVNHATQPGYVAGGLQLQLWNNETPLAHKKFPSPEAMATPSEVVRWTTRMDLSGGNLSVEIVDGASQTWGAFGGQGYLKLSTATNLPSLNTYSAAISAQQSGVAFAGNRVTKLVLTEVRRYTDAGAVYTETTDRVVHEAQ